MIGEWFMLGIEALVGLLLIAAAIYAFRLGRVMQDRAVRRTISALSPADPIADMLEAKAAIRTDELLRWAEAWRRAALLPDLGTTIVEIQRIEADAVIEHRKRERERERVAAVEAREAERAAREESLTLEREERERELVAIEAHEEHLAARRAAYARRRKA